MIVELYGLPGVGKSTLAEALAKHDGIAHVTLTGKWSILSNFLWFFVRFPRTLWRGFCLIRRYDRSRFAFWNFFVVRYATFAAAARRSGKEMVAVIDEGPLQNLLSLSVPGDEESLAELVRNVPVADQYLMLEAKEEVRLMRLEKRRKRLRPQLDEASHAAWQEEMRERFTKSTAIIKKLRSAIVVTPETDRQALITQLCTEY